MSTEAKWQVCSLDVLGNAGDGYEVNNAFDIGTVTLGSEATDEEIWKVLCEENYGCGPFAEVFVDWSLEDFIEVQEEKTGLPIFHLLKL